MKGVDPEGVGAFGRCRSLRWLSRQPAAVGDLGERCDLFAWSLGHGLDVSWATYGQLVQSHDDHEVAGGR
jgi:hypothetical protein